MSITLHVLVLYNYFFTMLKLGSVTSFGTTATTEEELEAGSTVKLIEIIFLPFHPIFQFVVVATAILKVYLVRIYTDLLQYTLCILMIKFVLINRLQKPFYRKIPGVLMSLSKVIGKGRTTGRYKLP